MTRMRVRVSCHLLKRFCMLHRYRPSLDRTCTPSRSRIRMKHLALCLLGMWLTSAGVACASDAAILAPGAPAYAAHDGQASFGNAAIVAGWHVQDGKLAGFR